MNTKMYDNPLTQQNIARLAGLGYHFAGPEEGVLACGDTGRGRMAGVDTVFDTACRLLLPETTWQGTRFIVTAGPTQEAIDPVRYLTNHSSGKMGFAIAQAAAALGADVTLVTGPVSLTDPPGVHVVRVKTAREMHEQVLQRFAIADVVIKAAAVADYRPAHTSGQKIKKDGDLLLTMVRNPDILAELGKQKTGQILVGFAAETQNLQDNALDKLRKKNLDLIVANDLTQDGAGFKADTNVVKLYFPDGRESQLPKMTKAQLAIRILAEIKTIYDTGNHAFSDAK
ncbi:MAG: bifunctional phosphopantothenoylcysteine decarboxylase/phosphopantothenate--cysteine ligase CoaBC, partial [Bacillota bacterium]|nr:bifunctional phosphopantothenoylcysteine decarboxylase/phosphopantothenate--cysteine ligase CoaBC [Bacillota bacterium]